MLDILATGYPSFDFIFPVSHSPTVGETALIRAISDSANAPFGGCGPNVAVGLSRLGFKTGIAMILGDDDLGTTYQAHLTREHVDQSNIIILPDAKTSRSYLFCTPDGEYQNFFYPGAADAWRGKLALQRLDQTRYGLVTVGSFAYNRQFVEQILSKNIPLIWQMKPDIQAYPADSLSLFLQSSEIILMNHIEARFVLDSVGAPSIHHLFNEKTRAILVTQGASGVTVYAGDEATHVTPISTAVVDVTGAGDGFTTGFLAGMLKGYDTVKAAQIGVIVASFVLEQIGCQTNLPDWNKMHKRYEEYFESL